MAQDYNYRWYTVSPASGTGSARVTVTAEPNDGRGQRRYNLVFASGGAEKTVLLSQPGVDVFTAIDIPEGGYTVAAKGGEVTLTGRSNAAAVEVECDAAVASDTPDKDLFIRSANILPDGAYSAFGSVGDNGLEEAYTFQARVVVGANASTEARDVTVTIGGVQATIRQAGVVFSVSEDSVTLSADGGSLTIEIDADGEWSVADMTAVEA
jgi:hypothetical protein